ncbi:MAG TPA: glyoxalase [Dehalococcoidia bacterium]|nr:glyoxalase [Dehalococcoidia bacterium]
MNAWTERKKKVLTGIRHTGIVVTDMVKALTFYRDLLGLKVVKDFSEEGDYIDSISGLTGVRVRMVKLTTDDGSMIELLQYLSHPSEAPDNQQLCDIGCSHVAFAVDNIEKEYARLLKSGVSFNCSPYISPDGYAKVTFCADPDGARIELVEVL